MNDPKQLTIGTIPFDSHSQNANVKEDATGAAEVITKSRTSAKEAISSRWESRAKQTKAKSDKRSSSSSSNQKIQINSNSNSNSDSGRLSVERIHENGNGNESRSTNPICQTWRHVQKTIGWKLLRHLEREQKLHGHGTDAKSKLTLREQHEQHLRFNSRKKEHLSSQPHNYGGSGDSSELKKHKNKPKKVKSKSGLNLAKNREELAKAIADLQASTALQNQLADITKGESKHYLKSVLSILPAGLDDETSAINTTILTQNRKRAFLLMDLGKVIRAHAQFISMTCGFGGGGQVDMNMKSKSTSTVNMKESHDNGELPLPLPPTHTLKRTGMHLNNVGRKKRGVYIQPQFKVTKNPSLELLKLLTRLGVDLRCNSSDDILAASQAVTEERRERHGSIHEDFQITNPNLDPGSASNSNATASNIEKDAKSKCNQNMNMAMHAIYGDEIMAPIVDDVSKTRKPNGYFRRLLQARNAYTAYDMSHVEVAVDAPDEVQRITRTLKTFVDRNRRSASSSGVDTAEAKKEDTIQGCRFLLRLPTNCKMENGAWERLVLSVHEAAVTENGELVGVSVDLSPWSSKIPNASKPDIDNSMSMSSRRTSRSNSCDEGFCSSDDNVPQCPEESQAILDHLCTHLRLFRLLLLSVGQYHIRFDLTGLPYPLSQKYCKVLSQTLKDIVCRNVSVDELEPLQVQSNTHAGMESKTMGGEGGSSASSQIEATVNLANDSSTCSLVFTADISDQLVARAGALCTRIIGVKAGNSSRKEDGSNETKMAADQDQTTANPVVKHYYIDDGCYGSLGSSKCGSESYGETGNSGDISNSSCIKHFPVPMYGNQPLTKSLFRSLHTPRSSALTLSEPNENVSGQTFVKSTVWGPTCDGLDKVCESVLLPDDLSARDWLVFSNLGCGGFGGGLGLGTAFNGFDPPDVAYCVLGYFSGASASWAAR